MDANIQAKLDEIVEEMDELSSSKDDDLETLHYEADDLLCEALKLLGQDQLVDYFRQVRKWYS